MLPAIMPGDMLTIERISTGCISEGDIVLYGRDRRLVVHRVVRRTVAPGHRPAFEIVTRGDAMAAADPPVPEGEVMGRVSLIERNGKFIRPRQNQSFFEHAVAAMIQRSKFAARVVAGIHGMRQTPSRNQDRDVVCPS